MPHFVLMRPDYYQLLDVAESATQEEIKLAYRRQAKRYHPDRNPGDAAAEERFILIAEAYRTLGDADERYQYDGWLEKQRRYSSAPELANMPHHTRVSVRHAYARREERRRRREERAAHRPRRRVPQGILHRRASKLSPIHYLVFYLICLAIFVPWFFRYLNMDAVPPANKAPQHNLPPGVSPLDPETQRVNLARFTERILADAHKGDPAAQYRYGTMLFHGYAGMPQNREAAIVWWRKAAEQGFRPAQLALKSVKAP